MLRTARRLAGEALADLTIWRTGEDRYEVMSGRREDVADLLACAEPTLEVNEMANRATFALQGPASLDVLRRLGRVDAIEPLPYFRFTDATLDGIACTIGRLGYTGEAGFEIICGRDRAAELWQALSSHARLGGFIAVDMLRIEAGFVLFSNEFRLPVMPEEAGLGKFHRSSSLKLPRIVLIAFRAMPIASTGRGGPAEHRSGQWRPAKSS